MITLLFSTFWQPVVAPALQEGGRISLWGWLLIALAIIFVLALLLIRATRGSSLDAPAAAHHSEPEAVVRAAPVEIAPVEVFPAAPVEAAPVEVFSAAPAAADDLVKIEGIGPKINQVLQENGVHTFAQLAAADVATLQDILSRANLRLANPATWPEQARLAAEGRWEEFEQLTDRLRGGKLV